MSYIFLGGIFLSEQSEFIRRNSVGVIQNAADGHQKQILFGLSRHLDRITVLNFPFIGSYPRRFRKAYFSSPAGSLFGRCEILSTSFVNLAGVKIVSRFFGALLHLHRATRTEGQTVFVYSAHLPFLLAAWVHRITHAMCIICVIVPDLPEFMGRSGGWYRMLKSLDTAIFYWLIRRVDCVVALTPAMITRMGIAQNRSVIVEGIAPDTEQQPLGPPFLPAHEKSYFLYTGTLARRYGIVDLLKAFRMLDTRYDVQLWICGEGDGRVDVEDATAKDSRVKYLGQLDRAEVLNLQRAAFCLVNPRNAHEEFTKYSFPSKTMEYLASGRPTIMYALPGMPSEYLDHFIRPAACGVAGLSACLEYVLRLPAARLHQIGLSARAFVLNGKSAAQQARKMVELVARVRSFKETHGD